jgi:Mg2+/Co2+ transporter CorB
MVDEKRRGARQLARLIEQPAKFLNPILLLVLICQLVSATLVGVVAEHLLGGIGVLVGAAFEVVVIFVFFEAVPRTGPCTTPSGPHCSAHRSCPRWSASHRSASCPRSSSGWPT